MSILFKVQERKNPQAPADPPKYYAAKVHQGSFNFDKLADYVAFGTSVSVTDALAVLSGLQEVMIKELVDGQRIKFGDFGTFTLSITSEGSELQEHVTAGNIKRTRIHFIPGKKLKKCLKSVDYAKVPDPSDEPQS